MRPLIFWPLWVTWAALWLWVGVGAIKNVWA
jgi:hypothetical protein